KSGAYVYRSAAANVAGETVNEAAESESAEQVYEAQVAETVASESGGKHESRRRGRGGRKAARAQQEAVHEERTTVEQANQVRPSENRGDAPTSAAGEPVVEQPETTRPTPAIAGAEPMNEPDAGPVIEPVAGVDEQITEPDSGQAERRKTPSPRQTAARKAKTSPRRTIEDTPEIAAPPEIPEIQAQESKAEETPVTPRKPARKAAPRSR